MKLNFGKVARFLGWFGLGLGLAELIMPRRVQKLAGVHGDRAGLIRFTGLREIGSALFIFMQVRPSQGMLARVAGDAMDLVALGSAFNRRHADKKALSIAAASVAGIATLDALTALQLSRKKQEEGSYSVLTQNDLSGRSKNGAFHVLKSITVNRPAEELYAFWRDFENLPRFMYHLQAVEAIDERRSHWITKAPAGKLVQWDAEIIADIPAELIAWQSMPGADVPNSGEVRFEQDFDDRGTTVKVEIEYRPPGGRMGKLVAKLFGEAPSQQVAGDLRRFKQVVETGEVIRSDGSPDGLGQHMQRPARPMPGHTIEHMPSFHPVTLPDELEEGEGPDILIEEDVYIEQDNRMDQNNDSGEAENK